MLNIFSNILDINKRELSRLEKLVNEVNSFEKKVKKLKDSEFAKKTQEFKKRFKDGEELMNIMPEAYALAREAAWRELGLRPYDVQIMAGIALAEGKVAEQKTGEGKTLSAVLPLYLHALTEKGVHLVTVNDYLARRDAGWNAPVFRMLGMSTGVIVQEQKSFIYDPEFVDSSHGDERLAHLKPTDRKEAYSADITYGTNNEYGFDYLRDNMVASLDKMVQRGHYFAIVDEVDSILIDEARTPLIISAPDTEPTDKYYRFAELVDKLKSDTDYEIDEKAKSATLTEQGILRLEKLLNVENLYEHDFETIHHVENALRARTLYLRDVEYVIKDDEVVIVDENTGRLMFGRRWSDGLHQAVEAKEGVKIQQESKTMATISFQNYFRMYENLSGMTATAATEAEEFKKIYNLDVVVIPTNEPVARKDHDDVVYKSLRAKYAAVVTEVKERSESGQPVLIGTTSIEKNEILDQFLKKKKIKHNVLNAKNHEREAMILADAGKPGAVTVATNMAGRGVDIVLGGAKPDRPEGMSQEEYKKSKEYQLWEKLHNGVLEAGGLHVVGTERHNSRRIDNQLRGRAGRQGDPGSSRFYLSLEDDLMRIFGGEQIRGLMDRLNMPEDQPIENKLVNRAIEQAQVKVEGFHFDARKRVVERDDVVNQQRDIIYKLRKRILESNNLQDEVLEKLKHQIEKILLLSWGVEDEKPDVEKVVVGMLDIVPFDNNSREEIKKRLEKINDKEKMEEFLFKVVEDVHKSREDQDGEEVMREIEKYAYLGSIDHLWVEHIDAVDALKEGVGIRGRNDEERLVIFKKDAYEMFESLMERIDIELAHRIFRIRAARPVSEIDLSQAKMNVDPTDQMGLVEGTDPDLIAAAGDPVFAQPQESSGVLENQGNSNPLGIKKVSTGGDGQVKNSDKPGRNDPCWCGSGKKYKRCHYPN